MKAAQLKSFRLQNFKAVRDSGTLSFTPLTVFIGNNGSGKSSLIEGLETLQSIVEGGLDRAMEPWRGFENVWHKGSKHDAVRPKGDREYQSNPMRFDLRGRTAETKHTKSAAYSVSMDVSLNPTGDHLFIRREEATIRNQRLIERDAGGNVSTYDLTGKLPPSHNLPDSRRAFAKSEKKGAGRLIDVGEFEAGASVLGGFLPGLISEWQFLLLNPQAMGAPRLKQTATGKVRLNKDGSNVADYLYAIWHEDSRAFQAIFDALHFVLPYAADLQPTISESAFDRNIFLQLTESEFKIPGWLLSTGTLRIVALLALLHHPEPPPLIVVEEIENGLDPRTISMLVEEMRGALKTGNTQIVATTHSPYLLDQLSLEEIVLVDRVDGEPTFTRPADQKELKLWAENFRPGQLYVMNRLHPEKR